MQVLGTSEAALTSNLLDVNFEELFGQMKF